VVAHKGRPGLDAENERLRKRLAKAEVKLGQTALRWISWEKRLRFWRCSPRARIHRRCLPGKRGYLRSAGTGDRGEKGVRAHRKSRATVYRKRSGTRSGLPERRPAPANALSAGEREELLAVLDSPRFADKAPRQVWAVLIDEGAYLASVSTCTGCCARRSRSASAARSRPSGAVRNRRLIATGRTRCGRGHYQAGGPAGGACITTVRHD